MSEPMQYWAPIKNIILSWKRQLHVCLCLRHGNLKLHTLHSFKKAKHTICRFYSYECIIELLMHLQKCTIYMYTSSLVSITTVLQLLERFFFFHAFFLSSGCLALSLSAVRYIYYRLVRNNHSSYIISLH